MPQTHRPRCFFDIEIAGQPSGRIIFELFNDVVPRTCENFRSLCTGEKGFSLTSKKKLYYKGCPIHRIVKGFIIQGGDFTDGNGTGGESIYGGCFADENFQLKHDKPYLLSMANRGKDTNGSQFFITTAPAPHLDGIHVVFGRLIQGEQIVDLIENLKVDEKSRPTTEVILSHCGELIIKKKKKTKHSSCTSSSSSSSSSSEDENQKKKSKKKPAKKTQENETNEKLNKKEEVSNVSLINEPVEGLYCSIKPDEIPPVPIHKFLHRRIDSPQKIDDTNDLTQEVLRERKKRVRERDTYDAKGRKVKGRGALRFTGKSRSRSVTPPHWRQADKNGSYGQKDSKIDNLIDRRHHEFNHHRKAYSRNRSHASERNNQSHRQSRSHSRDRYRRRRSSKIRDKQPRRFTEEKPKHYDGPQDSSK